MPIHDVHRPPPTQPPLAAHGDPAHHPVTGADLFDAQIGDDDVEAGKLRQRGIVDPNLRIEHLTDRQDLAGALFEVAQGHAAGVECDGFRLDRRDPEHRDEDAAPRGQIDDQSQDARLLAHDAHADHDIADPAEGLPEWTQHQHP